MALGRVKLIGLLGGIASGKSTVAAEMAVRGGLLIDADAIAHEVLRTPSCRAAVLAAFGAEVVGADGEVERSRLAAAVFGDVARVEQLNGIIHPLVRAEIRRRLEDLDAAGGGVAVLDVPLLLETPWAALCDRVVYVDCPQEIRQARVRQARGWDRDELARRESHQSSLELKRRRADTLIPNDGDVERTRARVAEFWRTFEEE